MQFENLLFCKRPELSTITEEESIKIGKTIALYDYVPFINDELVPVSTMVFLGKTGSEYEVLVIKSSANGNYIPHVDDYVVRYEENEQFVSFFFYCYYAAHKFMDKVLPYHTEYNSRPAQLFI